MEQPDEYIAPRDAGARVREVRRALGKSQKDFAAPLLIGGNSVGFIETGRNILSERTAAAICQAYNVNPEWLRTGRGEMFVQPADTLDSLARSRGLSARETEMVRMFIEQPPDVRRALLEFMDSWAGRFRESGQPEQSPDTDEAMHDELQRQLDMEKGESQASGRIASNTG